MNMIMPCINSVSLCQHKWHLIDAVSQTVTESLRRRMNESWLRLMDIKGF